MAKPSPLPQLNAMAIPFNSATVSSVGVMVVEEMSGAIQMSVPLKVDVGIGESWLDAK